MTDDAERVAREIVAAVLAEGEGDERTARDMVAALIREQRALERELCAKEMDHRATCELMHDCYDDLARARPWQAAAAAIRRPEPGEKEGE